MRLKQRLCTSWLVSLLCTMGCTGSPGDLTPAPSSTPSPTYTAGPTPSPASLDQDQDGHSEQAGDCNDWDASIYPGAIDVCNQRDDDCDGSVDEDEPPSGWYLDEDRDGFGTSESAVFSCVDVSGRVSAGGDCADGDPQIYPGAFETCDDGVDSDCDGIDPDCGISGELSSLDADAILVGESDGDMAGSSVSIRGDLDGDGRDDLVIGAPYADILPEDGGELLEDAGRVYVVLSPVFGEHALATTLDRIDGKEAGDMVGYSVASGGDVNGDGLEDLVVGARGIGPSVSWAGGGYLFHSPVIGAHVYSDAVAWIEGTGTANVMGCAVTLGPLDSDVTADWVVGALGEEVAGQYAGGFFGLRGSADGKQTNLTVIASAVGTLASEFGTQVSLEGDVSGDGIPDLIVSAPEASSRGCYVGEVYAFNGPVSGDVRVADADARLYGAHIADKAGHSISVGDANGDGIADLLVGAPGIAQGCATSPAEHNDQGFAYLVYGPLSGEIELSSADAVFEGSVMDDRLGWSVTLESDLDGDGNDDIVVGVPWHDQPEGYNEGMAWVVYGPAFGHHSAEAADAVIKGVDLYQRLGKSVAGGGDLNGDGYEDLVVSSTEEGHYPGRAYVFLGGPRGAVQSR